MNTDQYEWNIQYGPFAEDAKELADKTAWPSSEPPPAEVRDWLFSDLDTDALVQAARGAVDEAAETLEDWDGTFRQGVRPPAEKIAASTASATAMSQAVCGPPLGRTVNGWEREITKGKSDEKENKSCGHPGYVFGCPVCQGLEPGRSNEG